LGGTVSGWFDASAFNSAAIQIIASAGISAGAIFFEQTNDTTLAPNGVPLPATEVSVIGASPTITAVTIAASTARAFSVAIVCKYIRVRISTAFTGGSVQAVAALSQSPWSPSVQQVAVAAPTNHNLGSSAASTNATSVKTSVGTLLTVTAYNFNASARYLKIYSKASAPTVGTDVPVLTIKLPPGETTTPNLGTYGVRIATGIAYAITANPADSDATAVAAGDVKLTLTYS
jgi:hypothetical protein